MNGICVSLEESLTFHFPSLLSATVRTREDDSLQPGRRPSPEPDCASTRSQTAACRTEKQISVDHKPPVYGTLL